MKNQQLVISATDPCLVWFGPINPATKKRPATAVYKYDGKSYSAPRLAWYLSGRDLPGDRALVHTCTDNFCINANHLKPSDVVERDLKPMPKLTPREMMNFWAQGAKQVA